MPESATVRLDADTAIERLRENARARGGIDPIDRFLIHMVGLLGVDKTAAFVLSWEGGDA